MRVGSPWWAPSPGPVQRVANITAGKDGICGPSVLSGVLDKLGASPKPVDEIKKVAIASTGSSVGEIFTFQDMSTVANALGVRAVKHTFNDVPTLLSGLEKTGANPVLAGISNVGFPGKERQQYDRKLIQAGKQWVRAHWIAIVAFDKENETVTYKDNGDNGGTVALASQLLTASELTRDTWDWDEWGRQSGNKVPQEKVGKSKVLDLAGYLVEFQSLALSIPMPPTGE